MIRDFQNIDDDIICKKRIIKEIRSPLIGLFVSCSIFLLRATFF